MPFLSVPFGEPTFLIYLFLAWGAKVAAQEGLTILFTTDSFYPAKGGGDLSLRTLASSLSDKGHKVSVAYFGRERDREFESFVFTYPLFVRGFWPRHMAVRRVLTTRLEAVIRAVRPDVVITTQIATSATVDVCKRLGIPVVVFFHGVDFLCLGSYATGSERVCDRRCIGCADVGDRLLQFIIFRMEIGRIERSLRAADVVVSNSEYTKRTVRKVIGVDSVVLTPPLAGSPDGQRVRESGALLFVTPMLHKGVDIAMQVARNLGKEDFIFVGHTKDPVKMEISRISNIQYLPWVEDMSECYAAAKAVIVPSVIPEGYGRVCAEAISRGIPCIVSSVGALSETVGPAGDVVANHRDVGSWVETVGRYSSAEYTRAKSEIALQNADRFMSDSHYADSVEGIIMGLIPRKNMHEVTR